MGPVTRAETDVRTGGRYSIVFHTEDGEEHHVGGGWTGTLDKLETLFA
jgi:uncharacterized protein YndB with AHSA1/START domain